MNRFVAGFLCGFFLLAAFAWLDGRLARVRVNALEASLRDAKAQTSSWQARYAEASTSAERATDTVVRHIRQVSYLRDTLRITDTVAVKAHLDRADTLVKACSELANACALFRSAADSTIASLLAERGASNFYIEGLQRENASLRKRKKLAWLGLAGGVAIGAWVRGQ